MTGICACLLASVRRRPACGAPPQPAKLACRLQAWPKGAPAGADAVALDAAEQALFTAVAAADCRHARDAAVQGGLVRERYAEGFGADSRFRRVGGESG